LNLRPLGYEPSGTVQHRTAPRPFVRYCLAANGPAHRAERHAKAKAQAQAGGKAQIIREGIHLAAMSNRVWDGSLDWPTFEGTGKPATSAEVTEAVARAAASR
jgi:hypothetical protein